MIVSSPPFSFVQFGDCPECLGANLEVKQASDIAFQVLVSGGVGTSIEYVIATDSEVELSRKRVESAGAIDGAYIYFINSSASLYDLLTEGNCFKFGICNVGEQPATYSNLFKYSPSVEHTVLLEYRCDEEIALGFYYPNGMFNRIRLPCRIYKPQHKEENNIYIKRNGQRKVLSASLTKEFEFETDWISEEFHDRLSIALMHDLTIFDGKVFTKSSTYEIGWDDDFITAAPGKCKLIENLIYRNINCGGVKMADSVDLTALVNAVKNLMPIGTVVAWQGDVTKVPEGWEMCDGQYSSVLGNNRPDLRGRFVMGYGKYVEGTDETTYEVNSKGGNAKVILTKEQLPKHDHGQGYYGQNGTGFPTGSADSIEDGNNRSYPRKTSKLAEAGNDEAHENRPPYYTLAYIIRVSQPAI
jgi:microcystin-dependent protein